MYRRYFNLNKKPFQITSDNQFLWLGPGHAKALKLLKKGMALEQGVMMLTGDVGTGKTTLINEIIHTLDPDILVARIEDPGYEMHDLLKTVARAFGFEDQLDSQHPFSHTFLTFLEQLDTEGKKALVVVDESQRIPQRFLREIVSWFKLQSDLKIQRILNIILAGQLEFLKILEAGLGKTWPDYINVHVSLGALDRYETAAYIRNRLKIAGTEHELFDTGAIKAVHEYSKGIPRVINISCDQAMIQAFADGRQTINEHTFKTAVQSLELPLNSASSSTPPTSPEAASDYSTESDENAEDLGSLQSPVKENNAHKSYRSGKKIVAWVTAACICLLLGYGFYSRQPIPSSTPEQLVSEPKRVRTDSPMESVPEKKQQLTELSVDKNESETPVEDPKPQQEEDNNTTTPVSATPDPDRDTEILKKSLSEKQSLTDAPPLQLQPQTDEAGEIKPALQKPILTLQSFPEENKKDASTVLVEESRPPLVTPPGELSEDTNTQSFSSGEELSPHSGPDIHDDIPRETEPLTVPENIADDSTPENQQSAPPVTEQTDPVQTATRLPDPVISDPVKTVSRPPESPETKPSPAVSLKPAEKRKKIDMEEFIKEVFSFKDTPLSPALPPEAVPERNNDEVSKASETSSIKMPAESLKITRPEKLDTAPASAETEPSPDAFIDWLINQKKKR